MTWTVETLGTMVDAEIAALPKDMQASFLRLAERIEAVGPATSKGDHAMTSLAKLRESLLNDPEVKTEYERLGPIFALVGEMIEARQAAGLTQTEVASRMGTTQSVIARLENARHMPTFDLIARYAAAIGRRLDIRLLPGAGDRSAMGV